VPVIGSLGQRFVKYEFTLECQKYRFIETGDSFIRMSLPKSKNLHVVSS
jgi:hypothetical protein